MGTGVNAQLGLSNEVTNGTYVAVNKFYEFLDESLGYQHELMWSQGLRASQTSQSAYLVGTRNVTGTTKFELQLGQAFLWRQALGAMLTTGAGPYTHTATPSVTAELSASIQKGVPGTTNLAYTYVGCKVNNWTLDFAVGQIPTFSLDWLGMDEFNPGHAAPVALATASIATPSRLSFTQGVFSVAGSAVCIDGGSISGANNLNTSYQMCATNPGGPSHRQDGYRTYTGNVVADFDNDTQYQRFRAATSVACTLVFTSGIYSITVSGNVVFTGETPKVTGPSRIKQPMPFQFVPTTPAGSALSVVIINADATP